METVSTSSQTLQDETSVKEFFNIAATETLAVFEYLKFEFLYEFNVFAPRSRGEHESIIRQNSSERSFITTTTSTEFVQLHEDSRIHWSG